MKRKIISLLGAATIALGSMNVSADWLASGSFVGSNNLSSTAGSAANVGWTSLYLTGGAASGGAIGVIPFSTTVDNQSITVTFTAVCDISSFANSYIWVRFVVDTSIYMNPMQLPICAGRGTTFGIGNDVGTVTAQVRVPSAGTHQISVLAKIADWSLLGTGGTGGLFNSSMIINK